jgi:uncharacterized protein (TIGR03437 family)
MANFANNCISGMAMDSGGNVYLTGSTDSSTFPATTNAAQGRLRGQSNAFVLKLNTSGALVYSTFLGGSLSDYASGIQVDSAGSTYVVGSTSSPDFPGTPSLPLCTQGCSFGSRAFVTKVAPDGGTFVYSFMFAGSYSAVGNAIAVDAGGNAYVTGVTGSIDFPVTAGAYQTALNAGFDAFVSKIDPTGKNLLYSTFLGGACPSSAGFAGAHGNTCTGARSFGSPYDNIGTAIAVDQTGSVYVAGGTNSAAFPVTGQPTFHTAFVAKVNPVGSALVYSTYLGGSGAETVSSISLDKSGRLLITGETSSKDFPTTAGALPVSNQAQFRTYLAALNANGTALSFGTYLGGSGGSLTNQLRTSSVTVDSGDLVTVAGSTEYPGLPVTPNAPQPAPVRPNTLTGFIVQLQLGGVLNAPPPLILGSVVNAANFSASAFSPGTIVSLFGSGLGPSVGVGPSLDASGKISTQLSSTQALFDGQPIPLLYAGDGQINAVLPVNIAGSGGHQIAVANGAVTSNALTLAITATSPGLFTSGASGTGEAAALNYDEQSGAYSVNSSSNPAAEGSIVVLWATGCGATNPPWVDGALTSTPLPWVEAAVSVTFGGRAGQVLYAGGAPQDVAGVVQINVRIPNAVASGSSVPITLTVGGVNSQPGVTLALQ